MQDVIEQIIKKKIMGFRFPEPHPVYIFKIISIFEI
jgi:hypothetical protein